MNILEELYQAPMISTTGESFDIQPSEEFADTLNILEIERAGLDSKVWRWKPAEIEEWMIGERYLNLKDTIRQVVYDDVKEFFKKKSPDPFDRYYDEVVLCCAIGAGKSFCTSIISTYFVHLLLWPRSKTLCCRTRRKTSSQRCSTRTRELTALLLGLR
jgi:hypothetical protein